MKTSLRIFAAAIGVLTAVSVTAAELTFTALLDGKPIGEHRFRVTGAPDQREVLSEARFDVKWLGVTLYRYRHQATERWRGDCLASLVATTDDDGKESQVRAETVGDSLLVASGSDTTPASRLPGCVVSFAYWNPAIQTQSRLLNAQSGKLETVRVSRAGSGSVEVRGRPVAATRWRIEGPPEPIDVWYSAQGWVGLDSAIGGGRTLSYRLK
ncbi:MAG: DUF6134 family protein [Caldimonas sp.]